jgi:hypothetical protein
MIARDSILPTNMRLDSGKYCVDATGANKRIAPRILPGGYWDKLSFLRLHGLPLPTR